MTKGVTHEVQSGRHGRGRGRVNDTLNGAGAAVLVYARTVVVTLLRER